MATNHEKQQFGYMGKPRGLPKASVSSTFFRSVSAIPVAGTVSRAPGSYTASTILLRQQDMAKAHRRRATFLRALYIVAKDQVSSGGTLNIMPRFLGTRNGLIKHPKIGMTRTYMNPKLGAKTRPPE